MDYQFYFEFLGEADVEVEIRELEFFRDDEFDIDLWAKFELDADRKKYRIRITEDASPPGRSTNYRVMVDEKEPLEIDDGYTNWRGIFDENYDSQNETGFEVSVKYDLDGIIPVDFENPQSTI